MGQDVLETDAMNEEGTAGVESRTCRRSRRLMHTFIQSAWGGVVSANRFPHETNVLMLV